ncbi:hypothetical protein D9M70_502750 [compost metagenome]
MVVRDIDQFLRRAGADDELRAGFDSRFELRGIEDRAGAGNRAFHFVGNRADRFERCRRAQRDLDRPQPAGNQSARQRHGGRDVVDHEDRNDRLQFEDGKKPVGFRAHADRPF